MEYVIPAILVMIVIGGFVTFMVFNAMKKSSSAAAGEEGAPGIGADDSPLGDTTEHAGEQDQEGRTVAGQDAGMSGGTGAPVHSGAAATPSATPVPTDPDDAAHVARPGEGEGHTRLEFDGRRPPEAATPDRSPEGPPSGEAQDDGDREQRPAATAAADEPVGDATPASERLADRGV